MAIISYIFTTIWFWLFWIFLVSAVSIKPLTVDYQELTVGLVVALVVTILSSRYRNKGSIFKKINPVNWYYFVVLVFTYLLAEIKSHLLVIAIILKPKISIKPVIIRKETNLKGWGKILLAHGITMTPGTLTVDIDKENLYIHSILSKESREATLSGLTGYYEKIIEKMFKYIK